MAGVTDTIENGSHYARGGRSAQPARLTRIKIVRRRRAPNGIRALRAQAPPGVASAVA
jgi:hypothetical protein